MCIRDRLYIFEELEPVVEEQVKAWGIQKAVGKEIFTVQGEYSANPVSYTHLWLNFSSLKVLELLPAKARRECFEIL